MTERAKFFEKVNKIKLSPKPAAGTVLRRDAFFSKELLDDMGDILRQEYPQVFANTTRDQLKAAVQRHLASRRKSTESAK
jgi:hypothetical protein